MIAISLARSAITSESLLSDILDGHIPTQLALQPIFALSDMSIFGYEVLARWDNYRPDLIFKAAVRYGSVVPLERLVLRQVTKLLDSVTPHLFVNVHPSIQSPTDWHLLPTDKVILEITEDAAIRFASVQSLRDFGFALALDDLGKGSANLEALAVIQPEFIKLDKSMIQLPYHKARNSLIQALIDHTSRVGSVLIVEGIETPEQLQTVQALGAPLAQGYYLARPRLV